MKKTIGIMFTIVVIGLILGAMLGTAFREAGGTFPWDPTPTVEMEIWEPVIEKLEEMNP